MQHGLSYAPKSSTLSPEFIIVMGTTAIDFCSVSVSDAFSFDCSANNLES